MAADKKKNWACTKGYGGWMHVHPRNDLQDHYLDDQCWCEPYIEDGLRVHNSADKRELSEPDYIPRERNA